MPKITQSDPSVNPTPIFRKPKLWALIVGVNKYQDPDIRDLNFCGNDALGLATALHKVALQKTASQEAIFDTLEIRLHCDLTTAEAQGFDFNSTAKVNPISTPTKNNILASLDIFSQAQPQDTVLFYFSGHGFDDSSTDSTILCLNTTKISTLSETGLAIAQVVAAITDSPAKQQLIWLDACHSGGMASQLIDAILAATKENPQVYAITACDRHQESLELPQLGHGLFTYHLIQGLQGGVPNSIIKAEELYQYVYYKTLEYIDRANQLSQLIYSENTLNSFTPQRFAFGSGEFRLGLRSSLSYETNSRGALVIDGLNPSQLALDLSNTLANQGKFSYQPYANKDESIKDSISALLRSPNTSTILLYLKGKLEIIDDVGMFIFDDGTKIPREWLAQQVANSSIQQQVIILDCFDTANINQQVETFKQPTKSQCIVAASTKDNWLGQKLIKIFADNSLKGLTATNVINQISIALYNRGISNSRQRSFYRSAPQGEIINVIFPQREQGEAVVVDRNYCPYKGLEAFTLGDRDYFFGRDNLTQEIIRQLETSSFLPVVGASGSGKSSIVQAGVVPLLLDQGLFIPEVNLYKPCQLWILGPGETPFQSLASALSNENHDPNYIEGILNLGVKSFVAWLRQQTLPMGVLVIDQFEELFTQTSEVQRSLFLDLILGAVEYAGDRFKIIITLRNDFMASCLSLPNLGERVKQNPIFVPSYLTETEYRQIITAPATKVGLSVQPELVDVLISEVSQEKGALPLLEFTLEQLWLNRDRGYLSLKAYREKIGGIKKVLQERADKTYQQLTQPQQECAEWIFTQLVSLGEGQEDTRRRRNLSELIVPKYPQELITSTLNILRDSRLIVTSDRDGDIITSQQAKAKTKGENKEESEPLQLSSDSEVTVEIAHEILIRNWQQLRWWLDENREQIRLRERIEEKATEWKLNGQKNEELPQYKALEQLENNYISFVNELSYNSQEFIYRSIEKRENNRIKEKQLRINKNIVNIIVTIFSACAAINFFTPVPIPVTFIFYLTAIIIVINLAGQIFQTLINKMFEFTIPKEILLLLRIQLIGTLVFNVFRFSTDIKLVKFMNIESVKSIDFVSIWLCSFTLASFFILPCLQIFYGIRIRSVNLTKLNKYERIIWNKFIPTFRTKDYQILSINFVSIILSIYFGIGFLLFINASFLQLLTSENIFEFQNINLLILIIFVGSINCLQHLYFKRKFYKEKKSSLKYCAVFACSQLFVFLKLFCVDYYKFLHNVYNHFGDTGQIFYILVFAWFWILPIILLCITCPYVLITGLMLLEDLFQFSAFSNANMKQIIKIHPQIIWSKIPKKDKYMLSFYVYFISVFMYVWMSTSKVTGGKIVSSSTPETNWNPCISREYEKFNFIISTYSDLKCYVDDNYINPLYNNLSKIINYSTFSTLISFVIIWVLIVRITKILRIILEAKEDSDFLSKGITALLLTIGVFAISIGELSEIKMFFSLSESNITNNITNTFLLTTVFLSFYFCYSIYFIDKEQS